MEKASKLATSGNRFSSSVTMARMYFTWMDDLFLSVSWSDVKDLQVSEQYLI